MPVKYVFVTGGVVSGLGKGITAASLGRLLKARGYKVTMQKFDPYINIDPGTMNPIQHGEVFVTDDGAETDLDLGHYERFIDESLTKNSNVTTGKVYWSVLQKERRGDYGGGTVQVIPHITNEIKSRFYRNFTSDETHIAIIEVGGTVGDIESQPFLEAIRQFQHEVGHENAILIHVTLIPYLKASGELKTKPTQASVKELQGMGIQPDIIVCRSEHELDQSLSIVGAGAAEGAIDAASILKPVLARGEIQIIGATTTEEFRTHIQKDAALERRFGKVQVEEPTPAQALDILNGLAPRYEHYHNVCLPPEALQAAVELSVRYLPGRFLPDKAIDLVDEACAAARIRAEQAKQSKPTLMPDDIAHVVAQASGVPVERVGEQERERLDKLEERLNAEIVGQSRAVAAVAGAIRRSRTGLGEPAEQADRKAR